MGVMSKPVVDCKESQVEIEQKGQSPEHNDGWLEGVQYCWNVKIEQVYLG